MVNLFAKAILKPLVEFRISMTSAYECPSINTLVLSANKIENIKSDDLEKSLTLRINNKGPNIDPCGTP